MTDYEYVFKTLQELIDYATPKFINEGVTFYDPTRGWVLRPQQPQYAFGQESRQYQEMN